jgi:Holliday junction resolvasome RuvABC endonuclease subunit
MIKELLIKEVEAVVEKIIRKNAICIGWDVAEHYTGICILRTDDSKIYIEDLLKIETNPKEDIIHRMEYFLNATEKIKQNLKYKGFKIISIEDCWFGKNPEGLKHLARFSTLVWMSFRKECDYIFFILPISARAQIKFNKNDQMAEGNIKPKIISKGKNKGKPKKIDIKLLVQDYLKMAFGVLIEDSDKADGFVLALAGLLK